MTNTATGKEGVAWPPIFIPLAARKASRSASHRGASLPLSHKTHTTLTARPQGTNESWRIEIAKSFEYIGPLLGVYIGRLFNRLSLIASLCVAWLLKYLLYICITRSSPFSVFPFLMPFNWFKFINLEFERNKRFARVQLDHSRCFSLSPSRAIT